jgi:hypothetical protein
MDARTLNRLVEDEELRPYFFNYLSKQFALTLTESHMVREKDRLKFKVELYQSLQHLAERVSDSIDNSDVTDAINKVCDYYMDFAPRK